MPRGHRPCGSAPPPCCGTARTRVSVRVVQNVVRKIEAGGAPVEPAGVRPDVLAGARRCEGARPTTVPAPAACGDRGEHQEHAGDDRPAHRDRQHLAPEDSEHQPAHRRGRPGRWGGRQPAREGRHARSGRWWRLGSPALQGGQLGTQPRPERSSEDVPRLEVLEDAQGDHVPHLVVTVGEVVFQDSKHRGVRPSGHSRLPVLM